MKNLSCAWHASLSNDLAFCHPVPFTHEFASEEGPTAAERLSNGQPHQPCAKKRRMFVCRR